MCCGSKDYWRILSLQSLEQSSLLLVPERGNNKALHKASSSSWMQKVKFSLFHKNGLNFSIGELWDAVTTFANGTLY